VFRVATIASETYALKVINGPASAPRTQREIEALQRCNHPLIAQLYQVGSHIFNRVQYDFTVEEFLPGGTLTSRLQKDGWLDTEETFRLGELLIDAVGHVASLDLVHRDIKPDNIMFRGDGKTPVLVDFGLVRDLAADSLTQTWMAHGPGTPYFAAPEQLNNQKRLIDWRTDQFSLGVVLCYARFGIHPYQFPDEPVFSVKTIERVATRGPRSNDILNELSDAGLYCLEQMTRDWPVRRFRQPTDLAKAWRNRGGD
jgi:serine/threonine protein kinase